MPDTETPTATAPEEQPVVEVSPLEAVRADLAKYDGADEIPADDPAKDDDPAPATTETTPEDQAKVEDAIADAMPELTAEQIAKLAEDPNIVEAVLRGSTGQKTLDTLFKETVLPRHEQAKEEQTRRAEATKTFEEAIKAAEEEGDFEALGKLTLQQAKATKAAREAKEEGDKTYDTAMKDILADVDESVEAVYGDILDKLTQEELDGIGRQNFPEGRTGDKAFLTKVLGTLAGKQAEVIRSETESGVETRISATAADTAAAARMAREQVAVGALPGGSGVESTGDSISALLRKGIGDIESD